MSNLNVPTMAFKELEEQLAQRRSLLGQRVLIVEEIRKTQRRVKLLKELLELEGAEVPTTPLLEQHAD